MGWLLLGLAAGMFVGVWLLKVRIDDDLANQGYFLIYMDKEYKLRKR